MNWWLILAMSATQPNTLQQAAREPITVQISGPFITKNECETHNTPLSTSAMHRGWCSLGCVEWENIMPTMLDFIYERCK
jgi:hypothetical protein